uniref:Uncharacterized protein n=1 Tax=Octopus bimaculoides TaxID=37653 RepID=A0A0L8HIT4_OCTBM
MWLESKLLTMQPRRIVHSLRTFVRFLGFCFSNIKPCFSTLPFSVQKKMKKSKTKSYSKLEFTEQREKLSVIVPGTSSKLLRIDSEYNFSYNENGILIHTRRYTTVLK